jgi:hypothetical protein
VAQATIDPSKLDDVLAVIREAGLPSMRQQPGLHNVYVGVDRATGHGVVVSTWDTQEQASFMASPEFVARIQALGMQPERPLIVEVTDQV